MDKQPRAIVILYNGDKIDKDRVINICKYICDSVNAINDADAFQFSSGDIAKILCETVAKGVTASNMEEVLEKTPEDQAIIYIGTLLEKDLKAPFDGYKFFRAVLNKIDEFKIQYSAEDNTKLMNALFILSQEDLEISKTLLKKYHFSQEKILVLKKVYNFVTSF